MERSRFRTALTALITLALVVGASSAIAAKKPAAPKPAPAPEPLDYIAQRATLSQPIYPQIKTEATTFTTFDGEKIYIEITRPDPAVYGELALPTILEASPYHGTIATRIGDRIFPDPRNGNQNLGLTGYFAPRGYTVVMMDLRGTGRSTGCLDHLGPKDAEDMKLVIEWAADQPWSNGRVGMTGHSYVGSTPSLAAAQHPEGLVTIAPSAGLASMYDHQFQMGVPYFFQWAGPMFAYEALAMDADLPPGATDPLTGGPTGDNWRYRGGPDPQTGCGWPNSSLTAGSGQATGQYEGWHAARDWRALAADVDIPVFMIHGVNDNAARIPGAEWFFGNRFDRKRDKVWLGQWDHGSTNGRCGNQQNQRVSHPTCRFSQWQYALHAWFDKHLAQRDVDTGPPVEVFLNGRTPIDPGPVRDPATWGTKVFTAKGWTQYPTVQLFPDATDMSLDFAPPAQDGSATYFGADVTHLVNLASKTHVGPNLVFSSEPVSRDRLFVGLPSFRMDASVTNSQVVHLTATLYRENAAGVREPMNFCAIQPSLRNGVKTFTPVTPGQRMTLPMQCFTMAHWVPAGDHLELELSTTSRHHASEGAESRITVFTGPEASRYTLPEVPAFRLYDDVQLREAA
jgi:predicted acyl esterase